MSTEDLARLTTEGRHPQTRDLDRLDALGIVEVMNAEDRTVAVAVGRVLPEVARAVELIVAARRRGGRLIYLGAGTSGRLGLLDAVECPPTFGTPPGEVIGLIAGGERAFARAVEGAEDNPGLAAEELTAIGLTARDAVVGLAASGRTPYVIGGLRHARATGAATIAVACNEAAPISAHADVAIEVVTGPEVLTGSTRLKAGTAQKLICNMLSTASMVRTGKTYSNLMVDLLPTNAKLIARARRIVAEAAEVDPQTAARALDDAGGHAKTAIASLLLGVDAATARDLLEAAGGSIRDAVRG